MIVAAIPFMFKVPADKVKVPPACRVLVETVRVVLAVLIATLLNASLLLIVPVPSKVTVPDRSVKLPAPVSVHPPPRTHLKTLRKQIKIHASSINAS